jgi:hypothetical protein
MSTITTEDLIQYLYKDTSIPQALAIEKAVAENWTLREKMDVLKDSMRRLDGSIEAPRRKAVDFLLNYAASTVQEVAQH